ncbi:MAG TPA: TIGR00282 family metallophosphoesterase [Ruminiclostridium sp.]|nr:TIGR00282 family metallophosphoesterase [Ruminiclostridium sp.]
MNILAIGDVVGTPGCEILRKRLPSLKKYYNADLCIVNGENSADGNGITPGSATHIFSSGADVITTGNHVFRRREIYNYLDETPQIIRPANYPGSAPGIGYCYVDMGRSKVCIVNLMGTVYMDALANPFLLMDEILNKIEDTIIIVDFHAEATSEKKALGYYLDGRVSAVYGTHTHVQTSDEQILPGGTGYMTDIGMTGPKNSVLGVDPKLAIRRFVTKMPVRFQNATGESSVCGVLLCIDDKNGRAFSIEKIYVE